MDFKAFISGCAGKTLSDDERRFFAATRPCGLILFARNCDTPAQLRALVDQFKDVLGSGEVLVLIDQEGGRVQRLKPPHWRNMPPARCYGRVYETDREAGKQAAFAGARLTAQELYDLGINVNTMPVLDVTGKRERTRSSATAPTAPIPTSSSRWDGRSWKGAWPAACCR